MSGRKDSYSGSWDVKFLSGHEMRMLSGYHMLDRSRLADGERVMCARILHNDKDYVVIFSSKDKRVLQYGARGGIFHRANSREMNELLFRLECAVLTHMNKNHFPPLKNVAMIGAETALFGNPEGDDARLTTGLRTLHDAGIPVAPDFQADIIYPEEDQDPAIKRQFYDVVIINCPPDPQGESKNMLKAIEGQLRIQFARELDGRNNVLDEWRREIEASGARAVITYGQPFHIVQPAGLARSNYRSVYALSKTGNFEHVAVTRRMIISPPITLNEGHRLGAGILDWRNDEPPGAGLY